jgi:hypothetical protein
MMMEDGHLVEKQAKRRGLGDVKATWAKLGGSGAMNDALLSGGLDFASGGVPSLINPASPRPSLSCTAPTMKELGAALRRGAQN